MQVFKHIHSKKKIISKTNLRKPENHLKRDKCSQQLFHMNFHRNEESEDGKCVVKCSLPDVTMLLI